MNFRVTIIFKLVLALSFIGGPSLAVESTDSSLLSKKAKKRKKAAKKKRRAVRRAVKKARRKAPVEVPIDIGVGPALHMVTGPVQDDQRFHTGLKISLAAIIDRALIQSQKHRIPKKYRTLANKVDQVRFRPSLVALVPDTIFISPKRENTAMWGANWRLISLGVPLVKVPRLSVSTGLNLTYAHIDGADDGLGKTNFFRPGLDLRAELEIPFSRSFLVSVGWASYFYPPQEVGGEVFALGERETSIWHIGQGFLQLHFRVPYMVNL